MAIPEKFRLTPIQTKTGIKLNCMDFLKKSILWDNKIYPINNDTFGCALIKFHVSYLTNIWTIFLCPRYVTLFSHSILIHFPIIISTTVADIQLKFDTWMCLINIQVKIKFGSGLKIYERDLPLELWKIDKRFINFIPTLIIFKFLIYWYNHFKQWSQIYIKNTNHSKIRTWSKRSAVVSIWPTCATWLNYR